MSKGKRKHTQVELKVDLFRRNPTNYRQLVEPTNFGFEAYIYSHSSQYNRGIAEATSLVPEPDKSF